MGYTTFSDAPTYGPFRLGYGFNGYVAVYQRVFYLECTQLVGALEHDWIMTFHFIDGMSSFPLTFIFFRGVAQPPTSQDCERSRIYRCCSSEKSNIYIYIIIAITSYANCHGLASENAKKNVADCRQVP